MNKFLVPVYRWITVMGSMLIVGTLCLFLVIISFGSLRNFCVKYIFRYNSRFQLRLLGYSYDLPSLEDLPKHQVLYTINHNSYADTIVLGSIGIQNARYLLSEKTLVYIPLVIAAKAVGTRYIPLKKHAKRRLKFFLKTTAFLKRTNYSIIASAEGVHKFTHGINPFNKGIFHLAMEANIPIVPLFIYIPEEINSMYGGYSKTGMMKVIMLDEIDNSNWKLENIEEEIAKVRQVYVDKFNELNKTNIT